VKHFIYEAPEDIKNNLDLFLEYLQEKAPKTFNNIKDLKKFVEFLLIQNKVFFLNNNFKFSIVLPRK